MSDLNPYTYVELKMVCKFTKQFMYLKKAPAVSGHTLVWCGMSWGPGEAGGCLIGYYLLALSIFARVENGTFARKMTHLSGDF